MKSLLYLFRRYKLASSLNLLGLVVAFTGCYILLTQINYIGSYNHSIKDYEKIRRVYIRGIMENDQWTFTFNRPLLEKIKECPQVESVGYLRSGGDISLDKDGSVISMPVYAINNDMLTTVNAELVDGTLCPNGIKEQVIIPASLATKYFGHAMVAGKEMKLKNGKACTVIGIYKDFPNNTDFANAVFYSIGNENKDDTNNWNYSCYIRTRSDVNADVLHGALNVTLKDFMESRFGKSEEIDELMQRASLFSLSLDETYLSGYDPNTDNGSKTVFYILQIAVILLLLVALINYANFTMAQAPIRLRGINTRKVMGESTCSLYLHLVAEGITLCLCAFAISVLLAYCIGKWEHIAEYTLGSVALPDNINIVFLISITSIAIGVIATLHSARYTTSFQPALALKGNFGLTPRGRRVRQILVAIQFALAFAMVIFVGVIYSQRAYIYSSDYGYEKDALLIVNITELSSDQQPALRSELEKLNGVESASFSTWPVGLEDVYMRWGRGDKGQEGQSCYFTALPVDWKFLRTCGIDIVEGRDFKETDGDVYIINEAMKMKYPFLEVDKPLVEDDLPIVGVCKNFRAFTTRKDNNAEPVAFIIFGESFADWGNRFNVLNIRITPNTNKRELRNKIGKVLQTFYASKTIPEMKFMDDCLEQAYKDETRFMTQIEASTILAFLITIIGVFCLTMFETEYRRKEIAIRKVMGSSVEEVLSLFTQRYAIPLILSFVIAAPIGYFISEQWLQNFAEHTPIHWWLFPLAFLIVSMVVLLTVIVQSWRVATINPVESIKTE